MINTTRKKLVIVLMLFALSINAFGQASLCQQTEHKQLCDEIGQKRVQK